MPKPALPCKHCGRPEAEHHAFEAAPTTLSGCVCAVGKLHPKREWEICRNFRALHAWQYCWNCWHNHACHAGAQEGKT